MQRLSVKRWKLRSHLTGSASACLPKPGMRKRVQIGIVQPSAYFLGPVLNVRRTVGILSKGYVLIYVTTLCLGSWVQCESSALDEQCLVGSQ